MVYMYLSHYCDFNHQCRELALLSINSFQKDLAASNQLVRAMALRVMTSIRVPDVIQIQLLAVKKCAGDSSPYVRKCAANAIAKLVSLSDGAEQESCDQFVATLLNDTSPMVLGSLRSAALPKSARRTGPSSTRTTASSASCSYCAASRLVTSLTSARRRRDSVATRRVASKRLRELMRRRTTTPDAGRLRRVGADHDTRRAGQVFKDAVRRPLAGQARSDVVRAPKNRQKKGQEGLLF